MPTSRWPRGPRGAAHPGEDRHGRGRGRGRRRAFRHGAGPAASAARAWPAPARPRHRRHHQHQHQHQQQFGSEEAPKRAKTVGAGSADSPLLPMAEMLVFINTELPSAGVEWATVKLELASSRTPSPPQGSRPGLRRQALCRYAPSRRPATRRTSQTLKLIMA